MEIDGFIFELVCKYITEKYIFVEIKSFKDEETIFHVYSSRSQMGLWRLAVKERKLMYKGHNYLFPRENPTQSEEYARRVEREPRPEIIKNYYDYVQQTLIHVALQIFINRNIDSIEIGEELVLPRYNDDNPNAQAIVQAINDYSRQITKEPFVTLQKIIECGEMKSRTPRRRTPKQVIKEFSHELEQMYDKGEDIVISDYHNVFFDLQINGEMKKMSLLKKTEDSDENVDLYYLDVTIKETDEPSSKRAKLETHAMPFLLTVPDSKITRFGLYDKYIPSGAFICKLFDYSSGWRTGENKYKQCTKEEHDNNMCVGPYSYIGDRYNVFPFARGKRKAKRKTYKKKKH